MTVKPVLSSTWSRAYERLKEEATINWRVGKLLDRLAEVCGVDRTKAWPFVNTARMEVVARLAEGPSTDQLKAMDGEDLLDALHQLESHQADIRKRITLIHALRHVQGC